MGRRERARWAARVKAERQEAERKATAVAKAQAKHTKAEAAAAAGHGGESAPPSDALAVEAAMVGGDAASGNDMGCGKTDKGKAADGDTANGSKKKSKDEGASGSSSD